MKMQLMSFSRPDVTYTVDKDQGYCSCPAYSNEGWCKHLEAVGSYRPRYVTLSNRPSYSQALSGVVKSIRLRDIFEAAYWLNYCWGFRDKVSGSQFRSVRRLLIGAAEDGHSIAVMERVADAFVPLLSKDVQFESVLAELIRVCKVANWWNPETGGPDYIHAGLLGQRRTLYDPRVRPTQECLNGLEQAINDVDQVSALFWTMKAHESNSKGGLLLAEKLLQMASYRGHLSATRLIKNVYLRHAKSLSADSNFTCQAAWLLAGGKSPVIDQIEPVSRDEVRHLFDEVLAAPPHVIPAWCCDGIHCAGNDVRYAGMWDRMFSVCNQFKHYKRVSPDDLWIEDQFYSLEGLVLEQELPILR